MDELHNQVFSPLTLAELFVSWSRYPESIVCAGGTYLIQGQGGRTFSLPKDLISLSSIEELRRVSRTERYLEIGAMVTLSGILSLGKIVPQTLRDALEGIATPQVRNLATIGGNVCCRERRLDAFAPLAVLDARLELRTLTQSRWVAASRFAPEGGAPLLEKAELLTRIRVPLENWNHSFYKKIGEVGLPTAETASFAFIARAEKGILGEARLALAGGKLVRDREIENSIVGKNLPLHRKEAAVFQDRWKSRFKASDETYPNGLLRDRFLNLVEQAVGELAE